MLWDNIVAVRTFFDFKDFSEVFLVVEISFPLTRILPIKLLQLHLQLLIDAHSLIPLPTDTNILHPKLLLIPNQLITLTLLHLDLQLQQLIILLEIMYQPIITPLQLILYHIIVLSLVLL